MTMDTHSHLVWTNERGHVTMATVRRRGLGFVVHLLLIVLLFASFDLSLAQQTERGVPFFTDSASAGLA